MSTTANAAADQPSLAQRLGFRSADLVQQIGFDTDCEQDLPESVFAVTGEPLLDEHTTEVVDAVLLWWRDGDGDLVDDLVDTLTSLTQGGVVWLLTPKASRPGHVDASEINEAAPIAGFFSTKTLSVGKNWSATRLTLRSSGRK